MLERERTVVESLATAARGGEPSKMRRWTLRHSVFVLRFRDDHVLGPLGQSSPRRVTKGRGQDRLEADVVRTVFRSECPMCSPVK